MALSPTTFTRTQTGELAPARSSRGKGAIASTSPAMDLGSAAKEPTVTEPSERDPMGARVAAVRKGEPLASWSDVELLCAFREGNERAFSELYGRHKAEIYTYCLRMMSGDEDLASDTFQEVFIKVYEKAEQFRDGTNVTGWLYMIARNTCLNVFRTKRPNDGLDQHLDLESRDRSLAPEYDEEQHFLREKLEQSIAKLPVEFREPFIMREFDGFSYSEIAELTGTTLAVTKVRIHRAKQKMRELLKPYLKDQ